MKIHKDNKKEHQCKECGKLFSKKGYLTNHVEISPDGRKKFQCSECDKTFLSNALHPFFIRIVSIRIPVRRLTEDMLHIRLCKITIKKEHWKNLFGIFFQKKISYEK